MPGSRSSWRVWAGNIGLLLASLLSSLLALELACRVWRGPQGLLDWHNLAVAAHAFIPSPGRSAHDPAVGAVPEPDFRSATVNIAHDGTRAMPSLPPNATSFPPLLATGDSYTFGLDVGDDDTWPAILQGLIRRRVIDGGVPGFGLDQTVLHTERLAMAVRPALIVAGFIADDLWRSEFHRLWSSEKPYFSLAADGALLLHNAPVPEPHPGDGERRLSTWQRAFGWSLLIETVLRRLTDHDNWIADHERAVPAGTGVALACPLMQRLAKIGIPTLVVAQYEHTLWGPGREARRAEHRRLSARVLDCARRAGLATLDTFDTVDKAVRERGFATIYYGEHHTAAGNRVVAEAIADQLARAGIPAAGN